MTILLVGGGSGGHITPVLAVAESLKQQHPSARLIYAIGKGDPLLDIPKKHQAIDAVFTLRAGKFRRYHGEGLRQLLDIPTVLKNLRDFFFVLAGIVQGVRLLRHERPDAIFIKGGFVGVPVGLAAAALKIPYVTHDSDAIPGLANRIISRWAAVHAVALPVKYYAYPPDKTVTVGVPVSNDFKPVTAQQLRTWRKTFEIPAQAPVVCVTGGGNGSVLVNDAVKAIAGDLLKQYPELRILHIAGRNHVDAVRDQYGQLLGDKAQQVVVQDYVTDLARYSGAADIVITRAGATSLAAFAAQGRACIVIPNPKLTGGHQTKNAEAYAQEGCIVMLSEAQLSRNPRSLFLAIRGLLDDPKERERLSKKFASQVATNAADEIVKLLTNIVAKR